MFLHNTWSLLTICLVPVLVLFADLVLVLFHFSSPVLVYLVLSLSTLFSCLVPVLVLFASLVLVLFHFSCPVLVYLVLCLVLCLYYFILLI